jgi:hypothetical protein
MLMGVMLIITGRSCNQFFLANYLPQVHIFELSNDLVRERQSRIVGVNKSRYSVLLGICHIVQQKIYTDLLQNYYY